MTVRQTLIQTYKKIGHVDADVLLCFVLKKPKEFLYSHPKKTITKNQLNAFKKLTLQSQKNVPTAYLTGHKEFYGLDFTVNKNVLIPRPETEQIIEQVIKSTYPPTTPRPARQSPNGSSRMADGRSFDGRGKLQATSYKLSLADIGTGSGCIAITLKKLAPNFDIHATDVSKKALIVARKNAKKHNVHIHFYHGNLLAPVKNKKIDIIVANLPYLTQKFMQNNKNTSIKFEPKKALHGGLDGLDSYRKLFEQIHQMKYKPKIIFCEVGPKQVERLKRIYSSSKTTSTHAVPLLKIIS